MSSSASSPENPLGLLIASPQMKDSNFSGAVILMCQHTDSGALGIVLNRPTTLTVGEVLDEAIFVRPADKHAEVLWGGPVDQQIGFVVFSGEVGKEIGWSLAGGALSVSQSRDLLEEKIIKGERYRLCLGYSGWGPGQLESEIEDGSWLYTDADPSVVLDGTVGTIYDRALATLGLAQAGVWMLPINE